MNLKCQQLQKNNPFRGQTRLGQRVSPITNGQAHQHRAPTPPCSTTESPRRRHNDPTGQHGSAGRRQKAERQPKGRQPAHYRALTWQVLRLEAPPRLGDQRGFVLLLRTRKRRDVKGPSATPRTRAAEPADHPAAQPPLRLPVPPPPHPRDGRQEAGDSARGPLTSAMVRRGRP